MPTDADTSALLTGAANKATTDAAFAIAGMFVLASFGGAAALLRSKKKITGRYLISACLNSGLLGVVIGLLWWNSYKDTNPYFLIGVSLLAGLGGANVVDFVVSSLFRFALKKFGVNIDMNDGEDTTP